MSGQTRTANQARLVRCSAGCGVLVWLAGALPVAADADFVCPTCVTAHVHEYGPWRLVGLDGQRRRTRDEPVGARRRYCVCGAFENEALRGPEESGTPQPPDRHGEADGPAAVAPHAAPSSTAAPSLLGTGSAGAAVGSMSEEAGPLPCPADSAASSGSSRSGGAS